MRSRQSEATLVPFGSQRIRPCACLADTKPHIRKFLAQTFEELGFASFDCGRAEELAAILDTQAPDLVVIGYGIEAITTLNALAEKAYDGEVVSAGAIIPH
jgi:DNA-binding response OmpR family regulator